MHTTAQLDEVHNRVPFAGEAGHTVHAKPQLSGSVFEAQRFPQRWKPNAQVTPQVLPLHVGVPLTGAVQTEQLAPQLDALWATQAAPQRWNDDRQSHLCATKLQVSLGPRQSSVVLSQPSEHCPFAPSHQ